MYNNHSVKHLSLKPTLMTLSRLFFRLLSYPFRASKQISQLFSHDEQYCWCNWAPCVRLVKCPFNSSEINSDELISTRRCPFTKTCSFLVSEYKELKFIHVLSQKLKLLFWIIFLQNKQLEVKYLVLAAVYWWTVGTKSLNIQKQMCVCVHNIVATVGLCYLCIGFSSSFLMTVTLEGRYKILNFILFT